MSSPALSCGKLGCGLPVFFFYPRNRNQDRNRVRVGRCITGGAGGSVKWCFPGMVGPGGNIDDGLFTIQSSEEDRMSSPALSCGKLGCGLPVFFYYPRNRNQDRNRVRVGRCIAGGAGGSVEWCFPGMVGPSGNIEDGLFTILPSQSSQVPGSNHLGLSHSHLGLFISHWFLVPNYFGKGQGAPPYFRPRFRPHRYMAFRPPQLSA